MSAILHLMCLVSAGMGPDPEVYSWLLQALTTGVKLDFSVIAMVIILLSSKSIMRLYWQQKYSHIDQLKGQKFQSLRQSEDMWGKEADGGAWEGATDSYPSGFLVTPELLTLMLLQDPVVPLYCSCL